jgi:tRNA nucleotidyltransferase (CCA-adding enzyme)
VSTLSEAASKKGWDHFEHGADVGIVGYGPTPATAFENAALALTAIVADPRKIAAGESVAIACEAPDLDVLLVEWLNALIYEMATRRMLFSRFAVAIDGGRLTGTAWGEVVNRDRHRPAVEPKGATFTELRVAPKPGGGWLARCVVDV